MNTNATKLDKLTCNHHQCSQTTCEHHWKSTCYALSPLSGKAAHLCFARPVLALQGDSLAKEVNYPILVVRMHTYRVIMSNYLIRLCIYYYDAKYVDGHVTHDTVRNYIQYYIQYIHVLIHTSEYTHTIWMSTTYLPTTKNLFKNSARDSNGTQRWDVVMRQ